jgi:hypothetical protein
MPGYENRDRTVQLQGHVAHPAMTLEDIRQATGLPTSTVQRLVSNMVSHGILDRVGGHIRIVVAETQHALRRDMYVGKVIPLHGVTRESMPRAL